MDEQGMSYRLVCPLCGEGGKWSWGCFKRRKENPLHGILDTGRSWKKKKIKGCVARKNFWREEGAAVGEP